jgi:hypothetical protein
MRLFIYDPMINEIYQNLLEGVKKSLEKFNFNLL